MYKLDEISENKTINSFIADFKRSPDQLNKPHESDAEIICLGNLKLAITTDSISEEISTGLYDEPYLTGWMIVTVNMSDLAAVGASPAGIVISEIIPCDFSPEKLRQLQKGISDACRRYNTFILGGDTNEGENLVLTGTAIGIIKSEKPISRIGCKPGDILFQSGKSGVGNAYAISKLIAQNNIFNNYKPVARISESLIISKYASCCIDTSDGVIAGLDQLMRLNDAGFKLNSSWQKTIAYSALKYVESLIIPAWLLLAGQHGEFELLFTIPEKLKDSFLGEAFLSGIEFVESGKVISEKEIQIPVYNRPLRIDTKYIRNLPAETKGDIKLYLKKLLEYDVHLKNKSYLNFTKS